MKITSRVSLPRPADKEDSRSGSEATDDKKIGGEEGKESIKKANEYLIDTIEESLAIADEGKTKRAAAEAELLKMEDELKSTLSAAKATKSGTGDTIGNSTGA